MLVENIFEIEKEYYSNKKEMVIPELLCAYFDNAQYELTYYFSDKFSTVFGQALFYKMLSLIEMGYYSEATKIYQENSDDWLNLCKQWNIYWKHVALFCLFFKQFSLTAYYEELFEEYYEDCYVQLLELYRENDAQNVSKTVLFNQAISEHKELLPILKPAQNDKYSVLTFENIEWNIWRKYNISLKNGGKYGIETIYEDDGLTILSYKPKEVAASMHIIYDEINCIVLDCGAEILDDDVIRIAVKEIVSYYNLPYFDGVFITHAHMDHYGSLNELKKNKIYMTPETKKLIRLASPETYLGGVETIDTYSKVEINGITVSLIPNGHIVGSVLLDRDWKNKKRIVYTGDFSVEEQKTVKGFMVSDLLLNSERKIDVLLTETTYGQKKGMLSLGEYETIFLSLCKKHLEFGNKVVIPCFAIGRTQEIALLLREHLNGYKVLIDGMAASVTEFYQIMMEKDIINDTISICSTSQEYVDKISHNDVILASSGMLKPGSTSARYVQELIEEDNVTVRHIKERTNG